MELETGQLLFQGWFKVCAQPMRDGVTLKQRLSLAGGKPRMSPEFCIQYHVIMLWLVWLLWDFPVWCWLTHLPLGDKRKVLKIKLSHAIFAGNMWCVFSGITCQRMPKNCSQHWFRFWLGTVGHQAITWASVDLRSLSPSAGGNELNVCFVMSHANECLLWWIVVMRDVQNPTCHSGGHY